MTHLPPEEDLTLDLAELLRAELVAHPVLGDHAAGGVGAALDVVGGPGGDLAEDELLGAPAAKQHGHRVLELGAGAQVLVLGGQGERPAQRPTPGDDGHLVDRVGALEDVAHQGVATLVVGDGELLLLAHDPVLALGAGHHAIDGGLQLGVADELQVPTGRQQGRLVHEVGEVSAREARGATGEDIEPYVRLQRLALGVHAQDGLAALEVGTVDDDLPVEATGPEEGGVQDVRAVGGGDEDDPGAGVEAVHLHEHLVERLLALIVPAAEAGAAVTAHGVDLVHEDDGRSGRLGLLEQVTDTAGADADEHLDEVGARDGEERHLGLAGHGSGQQGLAGAGGAVQQHPLGDLGADGLEAGRVLEELLDLVELLDRLVTARHVGEGDLGLVLRHLTGLGLAELHHAVAAALHRVEHEEEQAEQDHDGQQAEQEGGPDGVGLLVDLELDGRPGRLDVGGQLVGQLLGVGDLVLLVVAELAGDLAGAVLDGGRGHLSLLDEVEEPGEGELPRGVPLPEELRGEEESYDGEQDVAEGGAGGSLHAASRLPAGGDEWYPRAVRRRLRTRRRRAGCGTSRRSRGRTRSRTWAGCGTRRIGAPHPSSGGPPARAARTPRGCWLRGRPGSCAGRTG